MEQRTGGNKQLESRSIEFLYLLRDWKEKVGGGWPHQMIGKERNLLSTVIMEDF